MPMIDTAEIVAERYGISREAQDAYALESQRRTAAAQQARPLRRRDRADHDRAWRWSTRRRSAVSLRGGHARRRTRAPRPDTTAEGLAGLKPVRGEGKSITAGNASQLSDGASACVRDGAQGWPSGAACSRSASSAASRSPAASRTRWASARSSPCRACCSAHGLTVDDIDLWELNEAFAVQVIYCRDRLGIDPREAQRQRRRDRGRPSLRHDAARGWRATR